jgi:hypothetical protein
MTGDVKRSGHRSWTVLWAAIPMNSTQSRKETQGRKEAKEKKQLSDRVGLVERSFPSSSLRALRFSASLH